jgi:hypothetical protein
MLTDGAPRATPRRSSMREELRTRTSATSM